MIRLKGTERIFISEDLIGFADKLVKEETLSIRLDLLLLGFSYAVTNKLLPAGNFVKHELVRAESLGQNKIAYEVAACQYAKQLNMLSDIDSSKDLVDFICRVSISGARKLQELWKIRGTAQIHQHIMELVK